MLLSDIEIILPDRVVTRGILHIEDGLITDIEEIAGPPCSHTAYPGFIDMHGDMIEQELEPHMTVDSPMDVALNSLDVRLAAAGVTTAYAAVSFSRAVKEGEQRWTSLTGQAWMR